MPMHFPQVDAKRSRGRAGPPRGGSADSQRPFFTVDKLRRECQHLLRIDPLARSLVRRIRDFAVGDIIRAQARSSDKDFNAAVEKWFGKWAESCELTKGRSLTTCAGISVKSAMRDGDMLFVKTDLGKVQTIEAERVRNPNGAGAMDTRFLRGGIELDAQSRVVRYHVAEWSEFGGGASTEFNTRALAAEHVLHLANPTDDEANLTRPEPGLSGLIDFFPALRNYITDVRIASAMAALFGLVTKTAIPQETGSRIAGETRSRTDGLTPADEREIELQPGFMAHLDVNEDLVQVKPEQPTTVFSDFLWSNLVLAGAEAGVPLVVWMLDLRQVNFHSARSAIILFWLTISVWRRWLIDQLLTPVFKWRVALAIARGEIPELVGGGKVPDDWDKCEWQFRPMPMLDPLVQAQADAYAVEKNLRTHEDVVATYGYEFEELVAQRRLEQDLMRKAGILPPMDPGTADPNAPQGSNTDGAEDTDKDGGESEDRKANGEDADGKVAAQAAGVAAAPKGKKGAVVKDNLQATALNGAQVTSLLLIGEYVADGKFSFDAAKAALNISFPAVDESLVNQYLSNIDPVAPGEPVTPTPTVAPTSPAGKNP